VEALFGPGYQLSPLFELSQPGQFAAAETIEVVGPKRSIPGVRVLGPARGRSQLELAATDGIALGVNLPVRVSGNTEGTPGAHLIGPRGAVRLTEGCIVAARHLHATPEDAARLGVTDRQKVYVRFPGPRGLIFDEVVVRVSDKFRTELHLDTDEGNAAGIGRDDRVEIIASLCDDLCLVEGCPIAPAVEPGQGRPFCEFTSGKVSIK
jgi:putative phosphotransacetylase